MEIAVFITILFMVVAAIFTFWCGRIWESSRSQYGWDRKSSYFALFLAVITAFLYYIEASLLFGRDSLRKIIRKIDEKYSFPMSYPFLMVGANSDTFSMFNKLTLQEKFAVYRECIDEVRRMVTMWHFFREAPMYISFSKTGDQCFNLKNFEVLNKLVSNKIKEMQDSEND